MVLQTVLYLSGALADCSLVYSTTISTQEKEVGEAVWQKYVPDALMSGQLQLKPDPIVIKGGLARCRRASNVRRRASQVARLSSYLSHVCHFSSSRNCPSVRKHWTSSSAAVVLKKQKVWTAAYLTSPNPLQQSALVDSICSRPSDVILLHEECRAQSHHLLLEAPLHPPPRALPAKYLIIKCSQTCVTSIKLFKTRNLAPTCAPLSVQDTHAKAISPNVAST